MGGFAARAAEGKARMSGDDACRGVRRRQGAFDGVREARRKRARYSAGRVSKIMKPRQCTLGARRADGRCVPLPFSQILWEVSFGITL